ncbi:MAG: carboxypeptidase-like regulatory domain-containing protein [Raineya sp.]|nr:carboxypeptidase-like regulatory domain-containing protein [Raineya sp.]
MKLVKLFLIINLVILGQTQAQQILLTGMLIDKQTKAPVPNVKVINYSASRGTISNEKGMFSMRVNAGDSLVIRSVNYRTAFYIVPTNQEESYSVVLPLEESVETIAPIQVFPYSDERTFREAFLNMETETEEIKAMRENLDKGKLLDASRQMPQDSQNASQQQLQMQSMKPITNSSLPTLNIFSPTAWREFKRQLKESKNEKERKEKNYKK